MRLLAAVYGFEITRPISFGSWRIEPVTDVYETARAMARDQRACNLTATVVGESLPDEERFKLEGVLCFVEHLDVVIMPASQLTDSAEPTAAEMPAVLRWQRRNGGGGAVIGEDTFYKESRSDFVGLAMSKLSDSSFCSATKFNTLLFKCIETFRQRSPFLEISYFLLFSGLESYARAVLNDTRFGSAAKPIHKLLESYGLSVLLDDPSNLPRSIVTYARLRNAMFHNSEFEAEVQISGSSVKLNASAYLFNLSMLVSLTILKAVGFDDGHTNWDAWTDRQLHR